MECVIRARLDGREFAADFGKLVFEGEGLVALALVGFGGFGVERVEGVAGFPEFRFQRGDAFLVAFEAVLGVGELLGELFMGRLVDGLRLEVLHLLFDFLLGGFGFCQRVFEFFHPLAGGEVVRCGGFGGGNHRGMQAGAEPPAEIREDRRSEDQQREDFEEEPKVACVHGC